MNEEPGGSWREMVASARQMAKEVTDDPRTRQVAAKAATGAETAAKHVGAARRKVTQEEAWAEATTAIEELVEVVVVQQELLEDLLQRVFSLESRTTPITAT